MDINKNRIAGKQYLNLNTAPNINFGRKRFFRKKCRIALAFESNR